MGVVFLARGADGDPGSLVVVKHLKEDLARDPELRQMLFDEARITSRLAHPNVVRTFETGFDGRNYYIAMEYLEGQPFDMLARDVPARVPRPLAIHVLARALAGLHAAHELRGDDGTPLDVVHRDVSPHNVFVTYDGDVKVLDFGIAKASDSSTRTRTGIVKGKATYMAPEQAARGRVDRRADVFAVGVMLWEVLAGRRFWGDLSDQEIFAGLQRGEYPSPRAHRPDVPEKLEAICMHAVAMRPEDRFATAAEMGAALDEWLAESGERVGRDELGRYVAERFARDRELLAREIELVTNRADEDDAAPVRGFSETYSLQMQQMQTAKAVPSVAPPQRRRWFAIAIGAGALGVAIAGVAYGTRASRAPVVASASAPVAARECAKNADCASRSEASICRKDDGVCVALASADCRVQAAPEDVANDATVWFGTMFPLSGPDAPVFGTANAHAAELARREIMEVTHGLPAARAGGDVRPLGIVSCDDAIDPARAARHLVDDLRVQAVIGFSTSNELLELARSLFIPRGVLAFSALNRSPLIRDIVHPPGTPRLVWRTTTSTLLSVPAVAALVEGYIEPRLHVSGALARGEATRVALLRSDANTSRVLADTLIEKLRFNGKSAMENGEALFRDFSFPESGTDAGAAEYRAVAASVASFRPHVILYLAKQFIRELIEPIESSWPRDARVRPMYIVDGTWEGTAFLPFLGKDAARRRRFLGLNAPTKFSANLKFVQRFNASSPQKVSLADAPNNTYDAFYLAAYAAFAAGDGPITGTRLAEAMRRLVPPGEQVDVGQTGVFRTFELLGLGKNVDVMGASGKLDFDLATGEASDDFVVQCVGVAPDGSASDPVESGITYDAATRSLRGSLMCP